MAHTPAQSCFSNSSTFDNKDSQGEEGGVRALANGTLSHYEINAPAHLPNHTRQQLPPSTEHSSSHPPPPQPAHLQPSYACLACLPASSNPLAASLLLPYVHSCTDDNSPNGSNVCKNVATKMSLVNLECRFFQVLFSLRGSPQDKMDLGAGPFIWVLWTYYPLVCPSRPLALLSLAAHVFQI